MDKKQIALLVIAGGFFIFLLKLLAFFVSNSVALLSDALESIVNIVASIMMFVALSIASRSEDETHKYGYHKAENISALIEGLLIIIAAALIVQATIGRLFNPVAFDNIDLGLVISLCATSLNGVLAVIMLRSSKKNRSMALEGDAKHLFSDVLSSVGVVVGLFIASVTGLFILDPIIAIIVAVLLVRMGIGVIRKTSQDLMDVAPEGISGKVAEEIMKVRGIHKVERIRVRESGTITFIEATVYIDKVLPVEQGHMLTYLAEENVRASIPNSDIIVHAEPICLAKASLEDRIRAEAANLPDIKDVHNISIIESPEGRHVEFHVEMDGGLTIEKAHEVASELERRVAALDLCISKVATHIEPFGCPICRGERADVEKEHIQDTIDHISGLFPEVLSCDDIEVHVTKKGGYRVNMCCRFEPSISVTKAHEVATRLEGHIRSRHTEIDTITIHVEPGC